MTIEPSLQQPDSLKIEQSLYLALTHHNQGRLQDAESLYRAILHVQPGHPDVNHNLGILLVQLGQSTAALSYFKTALDADQNRDQFWLSYINALIQAGANNEAEMVVELGRQRGLNVEAVELLVDRINGMAQLKEFPNAECQQEAIVSLVDVPQPRNKKSTTKSAKVRRSGKASVVLVGKTPSNEEISRLLAFFNHGQYQEAKVLARTMTERFPQYGLGWGVLGASYGQMGCNADALPPLKKAVELLPGDFNSQNNLGNVQKDLGRLGEAEASYRRALKINPDFAVAHNSLGAVLYYQGRSTEAEAAFNRAIALKPDFVDALLNLGILNKETRRLPEAETYFRRAIELKPDFAIAHNSLGATLYDMGRLSEVRACCQRALQINPDFAEAHNNLGVSLRDIGQLDEAAASFRRALEIKPDFAEAHNNLGMVLQSLGNFDDAMESFNRALEARPQYANAYINLGNALRDLGRFDEAIASIRHALEIEPDLAEAHSELLLILNLRSNQPQETMLREARRFGDMAARHAHPYTDWCCQPGTDRYLRVGLVSGDLRNHPVGYFIEGVLAALASDASSKLKIIAYPSHFLADALTRRIQTYCCEWHPAVGISDERLACQIHDDHIDILIDLSGHTAHNRLPMFAWRPAPVQVSWLGYFATTGIPEIDYLIADPWVLPESQEAYFTEKIWRLPETRLCFTAPDINVEISSLPALTNGYVTFGCFNHLSKINDEVVTLWSRVLEAVPKSRLFLKANQLKDASVRKETIARFAAHGIDSNRLVLEGAESREKYLAAYHRVDIALDPFPYTGGTTSVEGLWMGVPVLTLSGEHLLSRQGVGIMMNVGLPQWVAANTDDYVARAASHADDLQCLSNLRSRLRQQVLASSLFDAKRFAINFETALHNMWQKWRDR